MLMSRTKHAQCKQHYFDAQICLPSYTYRLSAVNCFDVDFIAVTRCDIPTWLLLHTKFAYADDDDDDDESGRLDEIMKIGVELSHTNVVKYVSQIELREHYTCVCICI